MAVSQGLVLTFLLEHGGKVRNSELLNAFRDFISSSEPAERRRNRDLFKHFVNNVAVVKQIGDVKYVVVKKKYQELVKGGGEVDSEGNSFTSPSLEASASSTTRQRSFSKREFQAKCSADALNNNSNGSYFCISPDPSCCFGHQRRSSEGADGGVIFSSAKSTTSLDDSFSARVLNVSNNGKLGKTGAVFAVVAIKSPPPPHSRCERARTTYKAPGDDHAPQQEIPSQRLAEKTIPIGNGSSCPTDGYQYRSLRSKRRPSLTPSSPATKRGTKAGFDAKDQAPVPLEPREHDWLVKSATGRWGQVCSLLLQDVHLAEKRSFVSGFTVLHWAAKKGNSKMVRQILDLSKQGGLEVDVNAKSHDGYTPLHVAAIHSHVSVLNVLVHNYGANCNIRDNSGRKPHQYLPKDVSAEVREMLGDPHVSHQAGGRRRSVDDQQLSDVSKGFNTFSKIFQSSTGHRKKPRHRPSFHFISDDQDENRRDCATLSRRPLH
ncbi:ankyrin repeat domain-containing protein SOWAHA [Salminus brasiliensis]|uniref:ankyrin repeat domain-containing protein SOWAHA n=1 Tax=Salminus brasiliensis TaxID=930266 RepID=UPI003B833F13